MLIPERGIAHTRVHARGLARAMPPTQILHVRARNLHSLAQFFERKQPVSYILESMFSFL